MIIALILCKLESVSDSKPKGCGYNLKPRTSKEEDFHNKVIQKENIYTILHTIALLTTFQIEDKIDKVCCGYQPYWKP